MADAILNFDGLRKTLGVYFPSLFVLQVDSDRTDPKQMTEKEQSTYYHEYIHFLQDISSVYGLTNAIVQYHALMHILPLLLKNGYVDDSWMSTIQEIGYINEFNMFASSFGEKDIECDEIIKNKLVINRFTKDDAIENVRIELKHESSFYYYPFGGLCILESMAFEIQKFLFPNVDYSLTPRFPYKFGREFASHLIGNPICQYEFVLICEMALMTTSPGKYFIRYANELRLNRLIQNKLSYTISDDFGNITSANEALYAYYTKKTFSQACGSVYNGNLRQKLFEFIELLYRNSVEHRNQNPFFISELLKVSSVQALQTLKGLHTKIGCPNFIYGGIYQGAIASDPSIVEWTPCLCIMSLIFKGLLLDKSISNCCPFCATCDRTQGRRLTPYIMNDNCRDNFLNNAIPNQFLRGQNEFCAAGAVIKNLGLDQLL